MKNQHSLLATILVIGLTFSASAAELSLQRKHGVGQECRSSVVAVSAFAANLNAPISGFRLAVAMDRDLYQFCNVLPGAFMSTCGWEYLTYRLDYKDLGKTRLGRSWHGNCVVQIEGFASVTEGHTASCLEPSQETELVTILLTLAGRGEGRILDCELLPIRFYWRDCNDNVLFTASGDTVRGAAQLVDQLDDAAAVSNYHYPGYGIPGTLCSATSAKTYIPDLTVANGALEFLCTESLICPGDINADGFPNQVADAVMYVNYFVQGVSAFGSHVSASVAASDINRDGQPLTLEDLAAIMRAVASDYYPY